MDFTKKQRIRPEKDFNKMANVEYGKLFRKDSENIFTEMIAEKKLIHAECIIIRDYFNHAILSDLLGTYNTLPKTSYYHLAREILDKVKIKETFSSNERDIIKRNKLNRNEYECLTIFMASIVGLGLTMATLKDN